MEQGPSVCRRTTAAVLLFSLLSLALTMPLPLHLASAVEDRQDALLNVWITAWDGHQLVSDPLHLFDANIFHPYPRTLAYSELLLGNGLLALPITAASGNPVLGYNVSLLLSFVLTALGTYLLVFGLTRSCTAGLVAGAIYAFSAYRMTNLAQAQLLTTQWMPFTLLALRQLMRHPRLRTVGTTVAFFCLQALSSFYYGILLALAIMILGMGYWGLARASSVLRQTPNVSGRTSWVIHLLLTACCSLLILLPFALPYFRVQRDLGFERTLAEAEPFSASLRQYAMVPPGNVVHARWLPSDDTPIAGGYPVDALFPGFVAVALGGWGLCRGQGRTRCWFFLLLLAAFCLSLGPRLYLAPGEPAGLDIRLPYAWLYDVVPGFKALRAPVRFDALVMLALAVLAGYGVASLTHAARPAPRWRVGIPALLLGLVVLESLVWPAARTERVPVAKAVPQVYRWLADEAPGPVLELPMAFAPGGPRLDYQYLSTYHWQPTPDGYSGFVPPKHGQIVYEMERFPSERSVSLLQALGVQDVLVHTDHYPAQRWREMETALERVAGLAIVNTFGADWVVQVPPRALEPEGLEVHGFLPARAAAGLPYTAYVIAVNRGVRSYAIPPTEGIEPSVTWQAADWPDCPACGKATEVSTNSRVVADVPLVTSPDGGTAVIPVALTAPPAPGAFHLIMSEQEGPLGTWRVEGDVAVSSPSEETEVHFPVPAQLVAWTVSPKAQPGQPLHVGLTWRALGKIDAYYSVYVKLLDTAGLVLASWDGQPRDGQAPTLLWVPGETIDDTVTLTVPPDAPPGEYTVEAGMYRAKDLARCLTLNEDGLPTDRVVLGTVTVEP